MLIEQLYITQSELAIKSGHLRSGSGAGAERERSESGAERCGSGAGAERKRSESGAKAERERSEMYVYVCMYKLYLNTESHHYTCSS